MVYINSVVIQADAVAEPVSRTDAKNWMRIDYTSDDTLIDNLISAARQHLEKLTGRSLACLLYTSPSPRDYAASRMPSSA